MVLDLFSRRVVGWALQPHLRAELALEALHRALGRRVPDTGLLHHSDRGSQYAATAYQQVLGDHQIVCSMSRKGDCWDNAPMESCIHSLKVEWTRDVDYVTRDEARADVFDYIEIFYNRRRLHSSIGYLSPVEYEHAALTKAREDDREKESFDSPKPEGVNEGDLDYLES